MKSGREPRKSKFQVLHLVSLRTSEPLFLSLNCTEVVPSFAPNENPKTCKAQVAPQTARKDTGDKPNLPVRSDRAVCRPLLNHFGDLFHCFRSLRVVRTQEPTGRN